MSSPHSSSGASALEAAFMKTLADKEFLAEAEKARLEIDPLGGEAIRKLVVDLLGMPESTRTRLESAMKA